MLWASKVPLTPNRRQMKSLRSDQATHYADFNDYNSSNELTNDSELLARQAKPAKLIFWPTRTWLFSKIWLPAPPSPLPVDRDNQLI
jgi:hypothetical protein